MRFVVAVCLAFSAWLLTDPVSAKEQGKPNILVIFGDDIGQSNVSACSMGLMGYQTPNIDRIAREGTMFTDYYEQPVALLDNKAATATIPGSVVAATA